jgi:hypothetical protein
MNRRWLTVPVFLAAVIAGCAPHSRPTPIAMCASGDSKTFSWKVIHANCVLAEKMFSKQRGRARSDSDRAVLSVATAILELRTINSRIGSGIDTPASALGSFRKVLGIFREMRHNRDNLWARETAGRYYACYAPSTNMVYCSNIVPTKDLNEAESQLHLGRVQ